MRGRYVILMTAGALVASAAPSLAAGPVTAKIAPIVLAGGDKGTLSYTDITEDPTVDTDGDATHHCSNGQLPSSPTDVNSNPVKVKTPGVLTVTGHNQLDWAMEIQTAKGMVLTGSDGGLPNDAESATLSVKPGTYNVVYCNLSGEPTTTADYTFKAAKKKK